MLFVKILIADHHAVVRRGLKQILVEEFEKVTIGEAVHARELLEKVRKQKWNMVVLDTSLPGQSWMDLLKRLKSIWPTMPVLVFSTVPESRFAARVLRAGAAGFITKESSAEELAKGFKKVLGGGRYVSPTFAQTLAFDLHSDNEKPPHETLSDREYQVMCMIATGMSPKEIAGQLTLSIKTISTYRARILEKTRMRSNAELIRYAIENRLDGVRQQD
jgi:two-component system, NarL family, invasion response regulator UvrY